MIKSDLNAYIGEMGAYQWRVFAAVFVLLIYTADSIHIVFIAGKMAHWCRVPELVDLPADVQKNVAIPTSVHSTVDHHDDSMIEYSSCEMFSLNYSVYNRTQFYSWNRNLMISNDTPLVPCSQWTYDQSQFISTIVSKVSLRKLVASLRRLILGKYRDIAQQARTPHSVVSAMTSRNICSGDKK